jgi:hypothetical protein
VSVPPGRPGIYSRLHRGVFGVGFVVDRAHSGAATPTVLGVVMAGKNTAVFGICPGVDHAESAVDSESWRGLERWPFRAWDRSSPPFSPSCRRGPCREQPESGHCAVVGVPVETSLDRSRRPTPSLFRVLTLKGANVLAKGSAFTLRARRKKRPDYSDNGQARSDGIAPKQPYAGRSYSRTQPDSGHRCGRTA